MNDDAIVRLRAMEPEDLDFLYAMENDKEVWDVGCTNVPYSRYVLHDYIANASNDIYADGQVRMVMEDRHVTQCARCVIMRYALSTYISSMPSSLRTIWHHSNFFLKRALRGVMC